LPDPKTIELARLYTREFYQLAARHLSKGGVLVTQATSPFFSRKAFLCILKTMNAAGFSSLPYHNHIPTMGEWGWVLGINAPNIETAAMRHRLSSLEFDKVETRFLNREAMVSMLNFGKGELDGWEAINVNQELELALYHYYQDGRWDFY
jgi:spermidine synthase